MTMLNRLIRFIKQLDRQELYQFMGGTLAAVILILSLFFYRYYSVVYTLQNRLRRINKVRVEGQEILTQYEQVIQQQQKVDEILNRDPNFKIKQFFIDTLKKLNLIEQMGKDPEVTSQELVAGYTENKMDIRLNSITMQQLVELLHALEQNERVYVKEIKITSVPSRQALDVALVVATFEKQT
jgi:type II secretory pathway component PulM